MLPVVLVVEDDPVLLRAYGRILASPEYELVRASTYEEALQQAQQHASRLRVLVTDQCLGSGFGTELAKHLQGEFPDLQVLILTGDTNKVSGYNALLKPFDHEQLVILLEDLLRVRFPIL